MKKYLLIEHDGGIDFKKLNPVDMVGYRNIILTLLKSGKDIFPIDEQSDISYNEVDGEYCKLFCVPFNILMGE